MSTETPSQVDPQLGDRAALKAFVEACLILEEGVAGVRDIDLGMSMGAGMAPGPFARADAAGLDDILRRLEALAAESEAFDVPVILRRLVSQGRTGVKSGQGFYAYPRPDEGYETAAVKLDTRGDVAIAWLDNPPANGLSPDVVAALERVWDAIEGSGEVRTMILTSANPALFCAGADIKAFTRLDESSGRALLDAAHGVLRRWERSRVMTIAAVNGLAFGGGCEIAMACDVRLAGFSATFGQPEVNLGIIPGFGGTQRLPRLVGPSKALEMNATGEPIGADEAYEYGLVNRVVADHELFDTAMQWARKFAGQAPVALQNIKEVSHRADLDDGIAAEKDGFLAAFTSADAREGIAAFIEKRAPRWEGR